uniref:Uncharacterized protein n=1 Tax=Siphoviridae sp. ctSA812 TaxID=2825508 RepID=A0A8S5U3R0_9CAUD|nr:MAG TPA: hypothetical protein [Siphoviridae sp. ctSA812]
MSFLLDTWCAYNVNTKNFKTCKNCLKGAD